MDVATYTRVSTEEQAGSDRFGIRSQHAEINRLIRSKRWNVVKEYSDAMSGTRADRPGLQEMLAAAGRKEFSAVIVARLDRLARKLVLELLTIDEFQKVGCKVISVAEPEGEDPDTSRLINSVIGAVAEFDKHQVVKKLALARRLKAQGGEYAGGPAAYGYDCQAHQLIVNPEQAAIVREIFTMRAARYSLQAIADALNEERHLTRRGGNWCASQILRTLRHSSFYHGRYSYAGIKAPGKHTTIL